MEGGLSKDAAVGLWGHVALTQHPPVDSLSGGEREVNRQSGQAQEVAAMDPEL